MVRSEDLDSGVAEVNDSHTSIGQDGHTGWTIKLAWGGTSLSELCNHVSTRVHDHDAIVPGVCNNEVAHVIHSDALRAHKLSVPTSLASQDPCRCPVGMNHQDVMHVEVRDDDVALVVECDPAGGVKMAAEIALVAKLAQEDSIVTEDEESVVACVSDSDPPIKLIHSYIIGVYHLSVVASLGAKHEEESAV